MKLGAGIVGATLFYYFKQYRNKYLADKDAMYRHYIQLHPDEFILPGLFINYRMHLFLQFWKNITMNLTMIQSLSLMS